MIFNPYDDQTFWGFLFLFLTRVKELIMGQLPISQLASDEIQVFVLAGLSASCALLGTFLVLRRMTMLANSLSHTILMGIVFAFLWHQSHPSQTFSQTDHLEMIPMPLLLIAALIMGFITVFLTEFLTKVGRLQEDASIGLVFTSLFALGIVLLTIWMRDAHIGTEAVMGNVDALHVDDLKWVFIIFFTNLTLCWLFFKEFKITTFDPALAAALGYSPIWFNYLLMAQVSTTAIGSFRAVGAILVLAFLTAPVLAARLLTHDLKKMLQGAIGLGVGASLLGVALTRHILTVYGAALSTSGIVVCVLVSLYIGVLVFSWICKIDYKNNLIRRGEYQKLDKDKSFDALK